jgi:hypothetical protein
VKARNAHTAGLNETAPGEVGEFDEKNVAVQAWLAAGMLVEEKPAEAPAKKQGK